MLDSADESTDGAKIVVQGLLVYDLVSFAILLVRDVEGAGGAKKVQLFNGVHSGVDGAVAQPESDVADSELFHSAALGRAVVGVLSNAEQVVESNQAEVGDCLLSVSPELVMEDEVLDKDDRDREFRLRRRVLSFESLDNATKRL